MKKFHIDLYRNKNFSLVVGILLVHVFFSAFFFLYDVKPLVMYNLCSVLLYGTISLCFSPQRVFATLVIIALEVPLYALVTGMLVGSHCGTVFFSFAMISGVYLYAISLDRPLVHYILISMPAVATVFILMSWSQSPVYDIFLVDSGLELVHRGICIGVSVFVLGYLCIGQQKELVSSQRANRRYIQRLQFISDHDHLTQIPNRRFIIRKMEGMTDFTVALLDIDNFKTINDTYGHQVGDQVLCRLTRRVLSMLPSDALMGRWGGEEFLIVFPHTEKNVRQIMESIRSHIAEKPFGFERFILNVSITAGVSWFHKNSSIDGTIAEADFLLYHGKKSGKNRIIYPTDLA